jgi:hypothetical protein
MFNMIKPYKKVRKTAGFLMAFMIIRMAMNQVTIKIGIETSKAGIRCKKTSWFIIPLRFSIYW